MPRSRPGASRNGGCPPPVLPRLPPLLLAVARSGAVRRSADDAAAPPTPSPAPSGVAASLRPADVPLCLPDGPAAVTTGPEDDPTLVAFAGSGTQRRRAGAAERRRRRASGPTAARAAGRTRGTSSRRSAGRPTASASFTDAVDVLRSLGATDVALVGASKGGTYAAALADDARPGRPSSRSARPRSSTGTTRARPSSTLHRAAARHRLDRRPERLGRSSSRLVSRADDPSTFLELSGGAHGVALFAGEHRAQVEQAIDDALAAALRRLDAARRRATRAGSHAFGACGVRRSGAARTSRGRCPRRTGRSPG